MTRAGSDKQGSEGIIQPAFASLSQSFLINFVSLPSTFETFSDADAFERLRWLAPLILLLWTRKNFENFVFRRANNFDFELEILRFVNVMANWRTVLIIDFENPFFSAISARDCSRLFPWFLADVLVRNKLKVLPRAKVESRKLRKQQFFGRRQLKEHSSYS